MPIRPALLASVALLAATPALAQTAANISAAKLLFPFTQLNDTAAGRGALADNLTSTIAINNAASSQRQAQAVSDNTSSGNGGQFTGALGTRLDTAYQAAIGQRDAAVTTITSQINTFTSVAGSDSNFNKFFLANGTTNGTTRATGPDLPQGGSYDTYRAYYTTANAATRNPYGDSRPFQTRGVDPTDPNAPHINVVSPTINAGLGANPSFPSGHTTFGTTVALLEAMAVPERFSQEIARGLDYGYSRVVLGVHYSMDAIAGRILGLHAVADMLNGVDGYGNANNGTTGNYQSTFNGFATSFRDTLTRYAGTSIATAVAGDTTTGIVATGVSANPADRLTYGIRSTGTTNLAAVVPTGAEVLLSTRFPYLTAEQRRDVLASTELPSGFALDDGSGWARLDLYKAGLGPVAFNAMATIVQDPSTVANPTFAGLAANDVWSNGIAGSGGFIHLGSGTLTLTGANSYTGGTVIGGGTVVAGSASALGAGDVTISGGTLRVDAAGLAIGGNYVQTATGILTLSELGGASLMSITGSATLAGLLQIDLSSFGAGGGLYQLIGWNGVSGRFGDVRYTGGRTGQLDYRSNGLFLTLAAAVPEPSSWATMVAGFGMVGFAIRRRRRATALA